MTREENEKRIERLKNIVLNMPDKPGSYQFYDADHTIIYVGKAKRLKQRVSFGFWEKYDDTHTVCRFVTSWATTREHIKELRALL